MKKVILEHISCDFCGCEKYRTRYRKPDNWLYVNQYEYPVVECVDCGLVYVNPRPVQDSMGQFYPPDYHEDRNTESFRARYKIESEYLPRLENELVLDIGCASGDFLAFLKKTYSGIKTVGVDYFSKKVDYDFIQFHQKNLPDANLPGSAFDLVTAWAVFEHLHDPSSYFREVNRILKSGGRFVFLVTNSESFYGRYAYVEDVPRHTFHFSEKSLNNYAEKFGFTGVKYFYEARLWDPTGNGTFYYKLMEFFGSTWEKRYLRQDNRLQHLAGRIGRKIDSLVFRKPWEAKKRRSGIIIAEFTK